MLIIDQNTLDTVRAARVMSRQIRLDRSALPLEMAAQVDEFLAAIGGVWDEPQSAYRFACHPHVAIGRAILNNTITICPRP